MIAPCGGICGCCQSETWLPSRSGLPALPITPSTGAAKFLFLRRARFVRHIRVSLSVLMGSPARPILARWGGARPRLIGTRFRSIRKHYLAAPLGQHTCFVLDHIVRQ